MRSLDASPHNIERARRAGQSSAYRGVNYDDGKALFSTYEAALVSAWSEGHNDARVQMHLQSTKV